MKINIDKFKNIGKVFLKKKDGSDKEDYFFSKPCLICERDSLEVIELLNSNEILLYCNNCDIYYVFNISTSTLKAYTGKINKELDEILKYNKKTFITKIICVLSMIFTVGFCIYSLIESQALQMIILLVLGIIEFFILIFIPTIRLNRAGNKIKNKLEIVFDEKNFKDKTCYGTSYSVDFSEKW